MEGSIDFNGLNVNLEFFIGGDLKFLQLILGLNGSTGNYACPWCKVHKNDRYDTSKPWDFYHTGDQCRNISELLRIAASDKNEFGVKNKPLLSSLELSRYIPDELHLMMRVTDVLLRNLIYEAKDKGGNYVDELVSIIRNCGIAFNMWIPKGTTELEWTSLSGTDRVKLMKQLPTKLSTGDVLYEDTKEKVTFLWTKFYELYQTLNSIPTGDNLQFSLDLFSQIRSWVNTFLQIGLVRKGYKQQNITPYIHCFLYHIPYFISLYGSLKKFSGQGVEKNNDIIKLIHQKKTNKWDAATESLKVRKRIEYGELEDLEREKRCYNKISEWWTGGILTERSNKRRKIDEEIAQADSESNISVTINYDEMTEFELRETLRKRGISTKIRKREKLLAMLNNSDN